MPTTLPEADAEFWAHTAKRDSGCWEWTAGKRGKDGKYYGVWRGEGAHRVALNSRIPIPYRSRFALHTCDNPICVNPEHLYWGSWGNNMQDHQRRAPQCQFMRWVNPPTRCVARGDNEIEGILMCGAHRRQLVIGARTLDTFRDGLVQLWPLEAAGRPERAEKKETP